MHTVHVITVLTTRRLVELVALVVLEAAVLCRRMESVAVTVSGGGTTAGPVHLTEIRNYLHLTVSQSFSSPFRPSFAVFACTSHESPCVMSSLIPPPLHAHIPYCIYLLSGPGSDSIFRVRAPAPTPSSEFGPPAPTPSSEFGPPAPTPSSEFGPPAPTPSLEPRLQVSFLSRAPAPTAQKPTLRFPLLHILYSSAN